MANLLLGPLLRYTGAPRRPSGSRPTGRARSRCSAHRAATFHVEGHHYALVVIDELEPGSVTPYDVRLDGERVWPPGRRPPAERDPHPRRTSGRPGSCSARAGSARRSAAVHARRRSEHPEGVEIDALWAFSRRLQAGREPWPDCLLLLGDQVYADEVSPETLAFIREPPGRVGSRPASRSPTSRSTRGCTARRGATPTSAGCSSTVPSTMIFDDHDVHDDWNISEAWVRDMRAQPWWGERDRRRVHGLLALPAPRQPRAAGARRGAPRSQRVAGRRGRRAAAARASRTWPTASRPPAAGRTTATSAARGSSWSTRAPPACSPTAGATWSTPRSGTGSSTTRAATTTT